MKPLAWHPGTATRRETAIFLRCSSDNSGKPYAHEESVRCAVDASIIFTCLFSHRETDSRAAASGRQRNTISAALICSFLAFKSLRSFSGREEIRISSRFPSLSKICSPVVPSFPSINTFIIAVQYRRFAARFSAPQTLFNYFAISVFCFPASHAP